MTDKDCPKEILHANLLASELLLFCLRNLYLRGVFIIKRYKKSFFLMKKLYFLHKRNFNGNKEKTFKKFYLWKLLFLLVKNNVYDDFIVLKLLHNL